MKPLQIGLLVLVGALGGAVIMKFTQRPKPVSAPVASAAPAPPLVVQPPVSMEAAPVTAPPATAAEEKTAALPESVSSPPKPARHVKPVRPAHPVVTTVARNLPPAPAAAPVAPPAPEPIQQPAAVPAPAVVTPPETPAPAPAAVPEPTEAPAEPEAPSVTLAAGMLLPVRLGENLSSDHNQAGDTFTATLDAPVSAGGFVIAERGARVEGRIVEAQKSNRARGQAALVLELTRLSTSDGQHVAIHTDAFRKKAANVTGDEVGVVAAAAGIGAVIGAIAGGGKGAAIGAGAGGAVGAGGVVATRAKAVALPAETKLSFHLQEPVTITERK